MAMPISKFAVTALTATAVLAVMALPAHARVDPRGMSCAQATALVQSSGSVVMTTGTYTYAMIYSSGAACRASSAAPQSVPTRDNPRCVVGVICLPRSGGDR